MSDKQFEGHTPAEQWTTYPMGADNPYHAVRIGGEGLNLPITKGADARLIAAAPELLAENIRLEQKLRGLTIAYDSVIDSINDFIETDYVSDDGADYLRYNLDLDTQYDAEEFGAEEFESEFSKGDLKKLKKYIDFPTRWINKETAPTSETKLRKAKNKFVGTLPAQKGIEGMKHDIYKKTPTWFKGIQLGILATIVGAIYVGETKKKGKK